MEVVWAKLGEGCVDLVSRGGLAGRTSLMVQRLLRSRLRSGRTVDLALTRSGERGVATLASVGVEVEDVDEDVVEDAGEDVDEDAGEDVDEKVTL